MPDVVLAGKIRFNFNNLHFDNPLIFGPYRIMQVGDLFADSAFVCPQHVQRVHEISYVVSGRAVFVCNGQRLPAEKGTVVVSPKGSTHEILPVENAPLRYYYIGIEIADCSSPLELTMDRFLRERRRYATMADRSVASAFQDVFFNMINQDDFSSQLIIGAVRKLLVWTKRSFDGGGSRVYFPEAHAEKHQILSEICSLLDDSVEDRNALQQLPDRFGYSYSYLSGMFSKAMGLSLREYFLMRRYEYERSLLQEGLNVTEVAERMGYSSVHSFSHAFAARDGMVPSFYTAKKDK